MKVYNNNTSNGKWVEGGNYKVSRNTVNPNDGPGPRLQYGESMEAPSGTFNASRNVREGRKDRIELGDQPNGSTIQSPEGVVRTNVQIHEGTASRGCLLTSPNIQDATGKKDMDNLLIEVGEDLDAGKLKVIIIDRNDDAKAQEQIYQLQKETGVEYKEESENP
jgi:hypothetical protein